MEILDAITKTFKRNSLADKFKKELSCFKGQLGFDPNEFAQGSPQWKFMKLGVVSASNASKIIATGQTRATYMSELVAQVCTGEMPDISAPALKWGNDNEDAARSAYVFENQGELVEIPFIYMNAHMRVGCSPDALGARGLELKCPFNSRYYIEFLTLGKIKPEWVKQVQFSMWVTGEKFWDFALYDPRMSRKLFHCVTIPRDEKMMQKFDEAVPKFIFDMDQMLSVAGFTFGEQWKRATK